jgi:dTMP kinase
MTARVLPGFVVGPIAGVIADRWDRKKTMIVADLTRALLIFSLPFVESLLYLLIVSAFLESLTLIWGPAKDASLPHFVPRGQLQHANSMSLIGVYLPWPLASIVFASLVPVATFLGETVTVLRGLVQSPEALALWLDSLTFLFSAVMIYTLVIPRSRRVAGKLDLTQAKLDLVEGLTFVRDHKQVRPWLLGIAFTFTAAGGVFSLGVGFTQQVLRGGESGFAFLIGFLGTGMIVGLLASGFLVKNLAKDVLFSGCLFLLGGCLIALAAMGSLNGALPVASALGFFGGVAYATAYSLMQESTSDEFRGRTFSAAYTIIRIGTLIGLGLFPFLADAVGDYQIGSYPIPGTRITLWTAGLVVIGGGVVSLRAVNAARAVPHAEKGRPSFVVFEGGEGAGKSTQIHSFVEWLRSRGEDVVVTREPGGTEIGARIRAILLDPDSRTMDARTEALLYAADRAQHVAQVIKPALQAGKIVVSDRFLDSSLAYQGLARGLGLDEVYEISRWAIDGALPDLVLWLRVDPEVGLRRLNETPDRMEAEEGDFHDRVAAAYLELSERFPERFVVLDATKPPAEVHKDVVAAFEDRCVGSRESLKPEDLPSSGTPVPR